MKWMRDEKDLLDELEKLAERDTGGQIVIFRLRKGWKAMPGLLLGQGMLKEMPDGMGFKQALEYTLDSWDYFLDK